MDLKVQTILIRLLDASTLAEMYPPAKTPTKLFVLDTNIDEVYCKDESIGWYCSRPKGHSGPHIRHKFWSHETIPPIVWVNKGDKE